MRKSLKKALSLLMAATLVVGLGSGVPAPTTEAAAVSQKVVDPLIVRPYHAYLCFQTSAYTFRDSFDSDTYGMVSNTAQKTALKDIYPTADSTVPGVTSYDWSKMFCYNAPDGTATTTLEFRDLNNDGTVDKYTVPKKTKTVLGVADFESPDVSYNGTYTVSMKNFDPSVFNNNYGFRMLYADTTIPYSEKDVKFSNVSLKIDGKEMYKADTGIVRIKGENESKYTYKLMVTNEYGYEAYGSKTQKALTADALPDPIWEAAKPNGTITMPKESIEITFTVSGLGDADPNYTPSNQNSNAASTGAIIASQPAVATPTAMAKGKSFTKGNLTYKVTKTSKKSGSATVAVTGVEKSARKKTSLALPKTVVKKDFKYKVTAVNGNAFAKCSKLKKVTLGANVATLEKNSFAKCKKLTTLTVNGKLTKVAKKSFAGCKQKIKVSGKSKKANIKALKKSGYKKFK